MKFCQFKLSDFFSFYVEKKTILKNKQMKEVEKLKQEVDGLDLKDNKDYLRFKTIRAELREQYKDELQRGRVPAYYFIQEKESKSFENCPYQGFEYYPSFEEHVNKHYLGREFENFEQEQYMWCDLALQYDRRIIFNL